MNREPQPYRCWLQDRAEFRCQLVETGSNPTAVLGSIEEPFDKHAQPQPENGKSGSAPGADAPERQADVAI